MSTSIRPVRLAFVGAGLFARDSYVPALMSLDATFDVVAVCSRTRESASKLNALLPHPADLYTDMDALLARDDVEAVAIVLPIPLQPEVVEKALAAGKHVISEKPVSPDVASGRRLVERYRRQHADRVWMVAENYRYEDAFLQAAEAVAQGEIGAPVLCHWALHIVMTPEENKYYHTAWRRAGDFPGGFILDGGVHQMAVLRLILGEVASVSAATTQVRPDLPPADTLSAALRFERGVLGTFGLTYVSGSPWPQHLHIVGDKGALRVDRDGLEVTRDGATRRVSTADSDGVRNELAAFAAAIRQGAPHRNPPEQALQDVALIEAMLRAAETGQSVTPERVV